MPAPYNSVLTKADNLNRNLWRVAANFQFVEQIQERASIWGNPVCAFCITAF